MRELWQHLRSGSRLYECRRAGLKRLADIADCALFSVTPDADINGQIAHGMEVASIDACADVRDRLISEIFVSPPPSLRQCNVTIVALRDGILALERHGWLVSSIMMLDEAWPMIRDVVSITEKAAENTTCMDIVGIHVDPRRQSSTGLSPHRDRQPEDWTPRDVPSVVSVASKDNGMARYVTLRCALADAYQDSSGLYAIPKPYASGYATEDQDEGDPIQWCLMGNTQFQNIRGVPVAAGSCTFTPTMRRFACCCHRRRAIWWCKLSAPMVLLSARAATKVCPVAMARWQPPI